MIDSSNRRITDAETSMVSCNSLDEDASNTKSSTKKSSLQVLIKNANQVQDDMDDILARFNSRTGKLKKIARDMEDKQQTLEDMQAIRELKLLSNWTHSGL